MPMLGDLQMCGTFALPTTTQAFDTPISALIPPYPGPVGGPPLLYKADPGANIPDWWKSGAFTHITSLVTTTGLTAHAIALMRPLNFCYVSSDAAINQAVINVDKDPGVYSTNYRYRTPSTPAQVADNAIAGGDYCAYQLLDGTWVLDTVDSVATLAITMTTAIPNVTGGGVKKGAPFFFFGIVTDKDPATGNTPWQTATTISAVRTNQLDITALGGVMSLHQGDPMMLYCDNATAAEIIDLIAGYYSKL